MKINCTRTFDHPLHKIVTKRRKQHKYIMRRINGSKQHNTQYITKTKGKKRRKTWEGESDKQHHMRSMHMNPTYDILNTSLNAQTRRACGLDVITNEDKNTHKKLSEGDIS